MTDHNLREIASRCEAKLHGFRRTADGVVVSFVLHPAEVPPVLALDPLGTRYMLAFVAIDDSEQPFRSSAIEGASQQVHKEQAPLREALAAPTPKARYAAMTAGEQAVQRAGMLPQDERFRAWVASERAGGGAARVMFAVTEDGAAEFIRDRCCHGATRRLIANDPEAMDKFIALETRFLIAVGQITGPR